MFFKIAISPETNTATTTMKQQQQNQILLSHDDNNPPDENDISEKDKLLLPLHAAEERYIVDKKYINKRNEILSCFPTNNNNTNDQHHSSSSTIDIWKLKELGITKGGYLTPELRRLVWPVIVGIDTSLIEYHGNDNNDNSKKEAVLKNPPTYELSEEERLIISQDVGRSVWHIEKEIQRLRQRQQSSSSLSSNDGTTTAPTTTVPTTIPSSSFSPFPFTTPPSTITTTTTSPPPKKTPQELTTLSSTITLLLQLSHGSISYYQGLHDLVAFIYIILQSTPHTALLLHTLSRTHLVDQTKPSFHDLSRGMTVTLLPLLERWDEEVYDFLIEEVGVEDDGQGSMWALPWVLSWFCHDVEDVGVCGRLVDFFLCSHPIAPLYMSVALLSLPTNRCRLLSIDCDDFASVHHLLLNLPKDMLLLHNIEKGLGRKKKDVFEEAISLTLEIMQKIPPHKITAIAKTYRGGILQSHLENISSVSFLTYQPPIPPSLQQSQHYDVTILTTASGLCYLIQKQYRDQIRRRKRRRRRLVIIAIIVVSTIYMWNARRQQRQQQQQQQLQCDDEISTMDDDGDEEEETAERDFVSNAVKKSEEEEGMSSPNMMTTISSNSIDQHLPLDRYSREFFEFFDNFLYAMRDDHDNDYDITNDDVGDDIFDDEDDDDTITPSNDSTRHVVASDDDHYHHQDDNDNDDDSKQRQNDISTIDNHVRDGNDTIISKEHPQPQITTTTTTTTTITTHYHHHQHSPSLENNRIIKSSSSSPIYKRTERKFHRRWNRWITALSRHLSQFIQMYLNKDNGPLMGLFGQVVKPGELPSAAAACDYDDDDDDDDDDDYCNRPKQKNNGGTTTKKCVPHHRRRLFGFWRRVGKDDVGYLYDSFQNRDD